MLPSEKWTMWQEGLLSAARSEQELKWKMAALVDARVSADVHVQEGQGKNEGWGKGKLMLTQR